MIHLANETFIFTRGCLLRFAPQLIEVFSFKGLRKHFDRGAMAGREAIARAANPGGFGLAAYTYVHLPMAAGIIMTAAADELTIAHPLEPADLPLTVLALGGAAFYLLGSAVFTAILSRRVPWPRLVAILALVAIAPWAGSLPALALLAAAATVLIALAAWDVRGAAGGRQVSETSAES